RGSVSGGRRGVLDAGSSVPRVVGEEAALAEADVAAVVGVVAVGVEAVVVEMVGVEVVVVEVVDSDCCVIEEAPVAERRHGGSSSLKTTEER
ncbi:hypothetical protein, partial [Streptomyces sp. MB09-02B]|uniref:hypothetical protein n=1 Tax=Streptomyces sp. MB09-02B TaxID=3028667 RepID=UPI0029A6DD40